MNKVFIINKGGHDHSDAERFGELVFLSEGAINRYSVARIYREFVHILKDSKPDDYVLITGLSVMSSIACAIFARLHGKLNLLLYSSPRSQERSGYYVVRTLIIDVLLDGELTDEETEDNQMHKSQV